MSGINLNLCSLYMLQDTFSLGMVHMFSCRNCCSKKSMFLAGISTFSTALIRMKNSLLTGSLDTAESTVSTLSIGADSLK